VSQAEAKPPVIPVLRRRLRALTALAAVTAIAVILAALALWQRAATGLPAFEQQRMFPSLRESMNGVTTIQVETKDASFNVVRKAEGRWIVPDKANYPADFVTIRKTILGLADLNLVERRTARADWHEKLGLRLPKSGGSGTLLTLKNAKGEVLASVIVGENVEGAAAGGQQAVYVRRPTDPQTYVARGNVSPPTGQAQWLDKAFIDLARDRVKTVAMKPFKGRAYTVTRDKPQDENFRIVESIPAGRLLRTENEPNGIGNALLGLSFDDVKPQQGLNFANAASVAFLTFDGLTLNLKLIEAENEFWMTVAAQAAPSVQPQPTSPGASTTLKPDIAKEAKEINALVAGWAYKIPRYKGTLLTAPLEDLLKPVGTP
jgi:hypothetical protein